MKICYYVEAVLTLVAPRRATDMIKPEKPGEDSSVSLGH